MVGIHKVHAPFEDIQASRPEFDPSKSFSYTQSPSPQWKPGQGLSDIPSAKDFTADGSFREVDPEAEETKSTIYKLLIGAVTPRPIALCSTKSLDGHTNLAPMSYFQLVSHNPPTIMLSIAPATAAQNPTQVRSGDNERLSGHKDTAQNILDTKEFCVSLISEPMIEASNYTCIDSPPDVDEWKLSGLTQRTSKTISVPHIAESAFSIECTLSHHHKLYTDDGTPSATVFLGRITRIHVKEFCLDPEDPGLRVDAEKLKIVSRLGGISYGRTVTGFEVPRPIWDNVKDDEHVKAALERDVKKVDANK